LIFSSAKEAEVAENREGSQLLITYT